MVISHDSDFYSWTQQQAALLRQGRLLDLDTTNLIEELEDMGRSEYRELESRLAVLLAHLLKWKYEPELQSKSWLFTIKEQRLKAKRCLRQNPGLKHLLPEVLLDAYADARLGAAKETQLQDSLFPSLSPWTLQQILNDDFWPE